MCHHAFVHDSCQPFQHGRLARFTGPAESLRPPYRLRPHARIPRYRTRLCECFIQWVRSRPDPLLARFSTKGVGRYLASRPVLKFWVFDEQKRHAGDKECARAHKTALSYQIHGCVHMRVDAE